MFTEGPHTTQEHDDFVEVTVNGRVLVHIEEGDVIENRLYNVSGRGNEVIFLDNPSWRGRPVGNFTIRNIGISGAKSAGEDYTFAVACRNRGLVENVYLGDGAASYPVPPSSHSSHPGGIIVRPPNTGTLTFRGINLQNWIDNAIYGSPPGDVGSRSGSVIIENCYAVNNMVSCYRFGSNDALRNSYAGTGPSDQRGVWAKYSSACDLTIEDCQLLANGSTAIDLGAGTTTRVRNTSYTNTGSSGPGGTGRFINLGGNDRNPSPFMPAGVPQSAQEAASGESGGGGEPGGPPGDPDEYDPLDPIDPSPYENTGIVRSLSSNQNTEVELWFNTENSNDVEWTTDYDAGLDWTQIFIDNDNHGWIKAACATFGRDGEDSSARKSLRSDADVIAVRFNQADLGLENDPVGDAQIELNGEILEVDDYPETPDEEPGDDPGEPDPDAPDLETRGATDIGTNSATIHGAVNSLGDYDGILVGFDIKERSDDTWFSSDKSSATIPTNIELELPTSGFQLEEDTLYDYRVAARSPVFMGEWEARSRSFRTLDSPTQPDGDEPTNPRPGSLWYVDVDDTDVFDP